MNVENLHQTKEKIPENVEVVETALGKFRLIYGSHLTEQPTKDLGVNYAGIVLEQGAVGTKSLSPDSRNPFLQYKAVLSELEKNKKPLFLVDPASALHFWGGTALAAAEGTAGFMLFEKFRKQGQKNVSRRDVLKQSARFLGATYLMTPVVLNALSIMASDNPKGSQKLISDIQETVHPEVSGFALTLRNLISAHKMGKIYQKNKPTFENKELAAIFGAGHTGLSDSLGMAPEERLRQVRSIISHRPFPDFKPEDFARIIELRFDENKQEWHVIESYEPEILAIAREVKWPRDD